MEIDLDAVSKELAAGDFSTIRVVFSGGTVDTVRLADGNHAVIGLADGVGYRRIGEIGKRNVTASCGVSRSADRQPAYAKREMHHLFHSAGRCGFSGNECGSVAVECVFLFVILEKTVIIWSIGFSGV